MPIDTSRYTTRAWSQADANLAVASVPMIGNTPQALQTAAASAGLAMQQADVFTHPNDGSWIGRDLNGRLQRGVGTVVLTGRPAAPTPAPSVQPGTTFTALPFPGDWASWRANFAVAKVPRADGQFGRYDAAGLARILSYLGFSEASPNRWTHPDGSAVTTNGGRIVSTSFQRWSFAQFPYQVGRDWGQWQTDTNAWNAWVLGTGNAPF